MRVLVLHAHPLEESLSAALRDRAVAALDANGHDVIVVRLGNGDVAGPGPDALAEVGALVLVYPTWWGAQPAALLDWIQQTVRRWVDENGHVAAESPLRTVKHLIVVTSHGSSRFVNGLQGTPGRHLLKRSVLPLCSPGAEFRWISLYNLNRPDRRQLQAFVDRVGTELATLTSVRFSD